MRIVVVDDDPLFLRLMQKAVEEADPAAVVLTARSYADGAAKLAKLAELGMPPDLIVVDSSLGDGDGVELLDFVRGQPALARIPTFLVTAYLDSQLCLAGQTHGATACHQKPAGFDPLVELARDLIAIAEQHAPAGAS